MTMHRALLLLALAAAAVAAPYGGTTQRCSIECPLAAAKLLYIPGKTYSYSYTGKSRVQLKGVDGGLVETQWEKQVLLTVLGPCDVAISIKGSKVDGETGLPGTDKLERYPLVVAMTDGRVQRVCSHPDDDTWAVNIKKGIASALQNSLPSLSSTNSGLNFTETDVVGTCSTYYELEREGAKVIVKKEKNHRLCQEHYPTPDETHLPYLMGPLPMQDSRSMCRQEIESGIISSVVCEDKKVVRPTYGAYKYVEAMQESTLRLTSSDVSAPDTISRIAQDELVPKTLRYDYETPKKEPSLVPQLEQTLRYLCEITKDGVQGDAAKELSKAVHLMRHIPEQGFKDIYAKVRSKQICPQHNMLRSLYMDAIAFVHEPESVQVMVTELVEGRATGPLAALYSAALYLVPRPNVKAIQAVEPLLKAAQPHLLSAKLAAASMVNAYCRHNPHCYDESPVKTLPQALKQSIEQDLSSSSTEASQNQALSAFKSLGNMGVMISDVAELTLRYMQDENKKVSIRIAAAQAFRLAKCERSVTRTLAQYALRPGQNTEVRIASYLAAIPCANYDDLQLIVTKISYEENTQVRGFILSHLMNLQQSDAPGKERLRYMLTGIVIPQDFEVDLKKYSRNMDLSYFSHSLGLGAEVESNLIFAPGSFVPRSVNVNVTGALDGTGIPINIGEIGARLEGLEPIIAQFLGPASYLKTSSYTKMFHDLVSFIQNKWSTIQQELQISIRERRSIDYAALESIISKLYGPQYGPLQADFFARVFGQEINYASISEKLQDINTDHLVEASIKYIMQMLSSMKNKNLETARAAQLRLDYSFPTIQGTPLKMTMEMMAVAGIKMETNLNGLFSGHASSGSNLKILPSLSVETDSFIGFDAYISKSGLKMNTTVSSTNGVAIKVSGQSSQQLQIEVDIPDKMEIIHVQSETFLMKHKRNQPDTKILPPSMQDTRIRRNSCFTALESVFGLKMCYDIDVPDIFRANSLPLGSPTFATLSFNKTESSIRGYKIAVTTSTESTAKKHAAKLSVVGSSSSKEATVEINLKKETESYLAEIKLQSPVTRGEAKVSLVNRPEQKSLQTDFSFTNNGIEFSKAIKVDMKISSTGNDKKYEMNIFGSPSRHISQESNIFSAELVQRYGNPQIMVDISAKTKNSLQQYIPFSLEVGGDFKYYSGVPLPMHLHKLEFKTGFCGWNVISFFRKTGESSQSGDYSSALQVVYEREELIDIQTNLRLQGTPALDFTEQLFVKAKVGQAEYKMQQKIEYNETRKSVNMQVTRQSDSVKLIEIVAEKDTQEIKFIFQVQMPEYMTPIKMAARAVLQGQDYNSEAVIMHGQQILVQLQGPVTFIDSPTHTKLGANIKINNLYQFVSSLEFEEGKQTVVLELKKQEQVLVSLEGIQTTTSAQRSLRQAKINLPPLFDGTTEITITENVIHISTNNLLLPRSSSPRRIKAFLDINWSQKQGQMMLLWDADKDPSKKIAVDLIIAPESGSPAEATMHVKVMLLKDTYHTNMKVVVPFLLQHYTERNTIHMEVMTPEQKRWSLEIGLQEQEGNKANVDLTFKSVNNNNYHFMSDLRWQRLDGPFCFEAQTGITYISPQNKHSKFSLDVKHQYSTQQHIIHLTMEASTPSMQSPLKINFSTENKDYSYITKLQSEVSKPETVFMWQLETYPEGGVKRFDNAIDLTAIRDVVKAVSNMVGSRGSPLMVTSTFQDKRSAYRYHYNRPSPDTHSVKIEIPSRTLEAEATYSPSKAGFKIYPNRAESEAKYEVFGEYITNTWGGTSRYEGRMSHPMLSRDVTAVVEYTSSGSSKHGSFQLDIFPDTADKIIGSLTSVLRANNTIVIDANLSTRVLKVKPRAMMEVSWAAHTKAFNFTFQETPMAPESFKVYAKYDRISSNYGAVTFQLATDGRPVVDVSGVMEPRQGPPCDGFALLANARTSLLGSFAVNSTVCKPAFLELAITKQNSEKIYKTKIGLQYPYRAEVSISETDKFQIWDKYISLISVELVSPRRVKVDYEYKQDEMSTLQEFVLEQAHQITEAVLTWTDRVCNELKRQANGKGVPFSTPEIRALLQEIKNDIRKIYADLIYTDFLSEWDIFMQMLRGPTATFIKDVCYQSLQHMARMQKEWASYTFQQIMELKQLFRPVINKMIEAVMQGTQWVQTGEEPEMVRSLVQEVKRSAMYQMLQTHVIEPIKESYPQQYETIMEVVAKVTDSFRRDLLMMKQRMWASPTLRRIILRVIDMTQEETLKQTLELWESQVMQSIIIIAPEPGTYRVGLQIPLYRPVYSLMQVVNMTMQYPPSITEKILLSAESFSPIPVTQILETYYNWAPTNLSSSVPPFNRSALVVGDMEILTFDGVLLRAPRSSCKVLLASVPGVASVYMSHPQPSEAPEITFQAGSTTAIIKPNMDVNINGRQVHGKQTVGDLVIEADSHYVTIVSPMMGVQRMKEERVVMVNASGWVFNHTRGLLGSYDNERANDRMMSNGRNASSLHDLVNSWQESPSCSTPSITPISPTQIPVKESVLCDFLFFQMKPCMLIVSPKPFMQRCHIDSHPLEAARSYQSFCHMHGVKFTQAIF